MTATHKERKRTRNVQYLDSGDDATLAHVLHHGSAVIGILEQSLLVQNGAYREREKIRGEVKTAGGMRAFSRHTRNEVADICISGGEKQQKQRVSRQRGLKQNQKYISQ